MQRRQYTRIKFKEELGLLLDNKEYKIITLDISAGGMKFITNENINIDGKYQITIPLSEEQSISCFFSPIRIEKNENNGYTVSGRFEYKVAKDRMTLIQYCSKRSIEIQNK